MRKLSKYLMLCALALLWLSVPEVRADEFEQPSAEELTVEYRLDPLQRRVLSMLHADLLEHRQQKVDLGPPLWVSFDPEPQIDWALFRVAVRPPTVQEIVPSAVEEIQLLEVAETQQEPVTASPAPVEYHPADEPGSCSLTVPAYVWDDGGQLMADGTQLGLVRSTVWLQGQSLWCDGDRWLRMAQCEGLNAAAQWNPAHISPTDDVGLFQINWVHGRAGGVIEGQWPTAVQSITGNLLAAEQLRIIGGVQPWYMSRHCWQR